MMDLVLPLHCARSCSRHRPRWARDVEKNGGLGLLIVQRIVQLHGRRIELRDSERGALFAFALPRAEPAA